ncbi:MAG: hypothetical protein WBD07_06515 [Vicinamibacterales bacterium]
MSFYQARTRNVLKVRVLDAFPLAGDPPVGQWMLPKNIWQAARQPGAFRAFYTYLRRLERYQLVCRALNAQGALFYRITDKGIQRLRYLTRH